MRRQGPPMNSDSVVSSSTSTWPWAGATMTLASSGTLGFGSRKNQRQNKENRTQRTNQTPENAAINLPTNAAKIPIAVIASSATSVQKINFSAACVALPLCFTAAILIGGGESWKEDICKSEVLTRQAARRAASPDPPTAVGCSTRVIFFCASRLAR